MDGTTGKLREPTPAEMENLSSASRARALAKGSQPAGQRPTIVGAGGGFGRKLGRESLSYMVVRKKPDGKLSMDCVAGEKAAAKAVSDSK